MGWLFRYNASKQQIVTDCLTQSDQNTLAHSLRGNELWAVFESKKTGEKFIVLFLLGYDRNCNGFGYKDMDEGTGPCYYSCPLKFLDMAPPPKSQYAEGWREKVREWHKQQAKQAAFRKSLTVGAKVEFKEGIRAGGVPVKTGTIRSLKPLLIETDGALFPVRARTTHIARVIS